MKNPTIDPLTGRTDYHTAKIANKNTKLAQDEIINTVKLNDWGTLQERYALPLISVLNKRNALKLRETSLRTRDNLSLVFVSEGPATQDIPVKLVA